MGPTSTHPDLATASSPTELPQQSRARAERAMRRRGRRLRRGHLVALFILVLALGCVLFACGSEEGPPACAGAACVDGAADERVDADGAGDAADAGDASSDTADAGNAADGGPMCSGEPGTLDPSFGDGGMVWLKYPGGDAQQVAIQPDGKILVVGVTAPAGEHLAMVRLMPDGSLDTTFGTNGLVERRVGTVTHVLAAVTLQRDGKVIAAGHVRSSGQPSNIAVLRQLGDGGPDPTFGDAGLVLTSYPGRDAYGRSVVLDPTGKILVAGFSEDAVDPTASADYEIVRYDADGTLDPTFGSGGKIRIDVHGTSDSNGVLARLAGGGLVVAGGSRRTAAVVGPSDMSAVALLGTGAVDTSFADAGGFVSNVATGSWSVRAVAVDGAGRILLAGLTGADFALVRLTPKGVLDATFGSAGMLTTDFSSRGDDAYGVYVRPDGSILLAGTSSSAGGDPGIALAQYGADGELDRAFGTGGRSLTLPPGDAYYGVNGAAISGCHVVVVGGWTYDVNTLPRKAMGVARYRR